jgi:putative intracellular protease/amidase
MRSVLRFAWPLLIACALVAGALAASPPADAPAKGKKYVCAPCGMPCDKKVFDKPGRCPDCGGNLVEQAAVRTAVAPPKPKTAAILLFEGVQIIDYTGPYEVLGQGGFDVFTVAETKAPLTTSMGMKVIPQYSFADAPKADVLVVPGGNVEVPRRSAATLKWLKEESAAAQHTMSVCNGAFILAKAGLLDGLGATTFYGMIDDLKREATKTKVVSDQRYVDNGKIITTAGLSSGIDGALHLISKMIGNGRAQAVALNMEYDWRPDSHYARAALADRLIPDINLSGLGSWSTVRTEGTTDKWDIVLHLSTELTQAQLLDQISQAFTREGKWAGVPSVAAAASASRSDWKFNGPDGRPWNGSLRVEAVPASSGEYTLTLNIARVG